MFCRLFKISSITCDSKEQALEFCQYMRRHYHKICLPISNQIYFKELESEPSDFVFTEYYELYVA